MGILEDAENKMKLALEHLKTELKGIRTGHANPAMLEGVMVEMYGSNMRLRDVASITTPEPRQLLITPFDPSSTSLIGKAIERANLGFMPITDANQVRVNVPAMDTNLRKEMVKLCHQFCEKSKVSIRNLRRDANEESRKQKSSSVISEDELKKKEQQIQKLTDKYCLEAEKLAQLKEQEVSKI